MSAILQNADKYTMRKVAHGILHFRSDEDRQRVDELMLHQSSAMRSAYQAIRKHDLKNNDIKVYVKQNFMPLLNQRHISDAVSIAKQQVKEGLSGKVIFGGKKLWQAFMSGLISKDEWSSRRNNQLYSRGDKTKQGNPNLRIDPDRSLLLINDPSSRGRWIKANLFLPVKWTPDFTCYDVRIVRKNGCYEVKVSWDEEPIPLLPVIPGVIGIDTNPDGVALVEVNGEGNLLTHRYIQKQRLPFASQNKREYDLRLLAKEVVEYALEVQKPIVIEKLQFKRVQKKGFKKFNRMKSNFLHRKVIEAIKSRAERYGVQVVEVNPAFTSVLGILKYEQMYSLNRHTAAALVIARRGMGIKEKQTFAVKYSGKKNDRVNLEGRSRSDTLSQKAWSWLEKEFLQPNRADLTGPGLVLSHGESIGLSAGGIPAG